MKKEIKQDLKEDIKHLEGKIEEKAIEVVENVRSIARKSKKVDKGE